MGTQKRNSKCHYFVINSFSNEPKNKKKTFQQNMNNSDLSSRLIQKTKNNLSDVHLDPGGKSNPVHPGDNANANSEPNSEQSVSFDEHLKESGTSSIGKNSVSLKRNEIEKCITLLKHAMQCKKADCEKKSCAKMKRLSIHIKRCRKENHTETSIESCQLCKQVCTDACWYLFETIQRTRNLSLESFQKRTSLWECTDERYALILVYCIVLLPC